MDEISLAMQIREAEWRIAHGYVAQQYATDHVLTLLVEIRRLRAVNATQREIVTAVARVDDVDDMIECPFCFASSLHHATSRGADCPITKARALLAQEGEA